MNMTKQHFEEFARLMNAEQGLHQPQSPQWLALYTFTCSWADVCYRSNPRFNRGKFMTACGFPYPF
jgi:hypothetical protein